jgi:hypothetical protein
MATEASSPVSVGPEPQYRLKSTLSELKSWQSNDMPPLDAQHRIRIMILEATETYRHLTSLAWVEPITGPRFKDLMERRDEQAGRSWLLRKAISSLKKTPPEIARQIFSYRSAGSVTLPARRHEPLWRLTHICSHWRQAL